MLRYYAWPVAEKALGCLPGGSRVYEAAGYLAQRKSKGRSSGYRVAFPLARKARQLLPDGGSVLDIGTGWFHLDAFLIWLVGHYKIYLFDVSDKARLAYIQNYLRHLIANIEIVSSELGIDPDSSATRLEELLALRTRAQIYETCNFQLCISARPDQPLLPDDSIDLMVSDCVLNHIPVSTLIPELNMLRRCLKSSGYMYHMLGHEDHWFFHDRNQNRFNYYRYSDRAYRLLLETHFEFQNRLVKEEWLRIFDGCGLDVDEYEGIISDESRAEIARLRHIDGRFAGYPPEDLAITHSYVLLKKRPVLDADGARSARDTSQGRDGRTAAGAGAR